MVTLRREWTERYQRCDDNTADEIHEATEIICRYLKSWDLETISTTISTRPGGISLSTRVPCATCW